MAKKIHSPAKFENQIKHTATKHRLTPKQHNVLLINVQHTYEEDNNWIPKLLDTPQTLINKRVSTDWGHLNVVPTTFCPFSAISLRWDKLSRYLGLIIKSFSIKSIASEDTDSKYVRGNVRARCEIFRNVSCLQSPPNGDNPDRST